MAAVFASLVGLLGPVCAADENTAITLDTSETLFAVLTAMNACGYDVDLNISDAQRLNVRAEVDRNMRDSDEAQAARAAFSPAQIVMGRPPSGEGVLMWRNHRKLQFLTHRLRCHLHAEWSALGETRPVEDVLRDLQEVHRATLTVDSVVVRRLATHPSKAVAALLDRLNRKKA